MCRGGSFALALFPWEAVSLKFALFVLSYLIVGGEVLGGPAKIFSGGRYLIRIFSWPWPPWGPLPLGNILKGWR